MTKAYIVTSGEYSDYRIEAVFLDKELAEKHASQIEDAYVEEWDIQATLPQKLVRYVVTINEDGAERVRFSTTCFDYEGEVIESAKDEGRWITGVSYRGFDVALKAARDKLAQRKARETGL